MFFVPEVELCGYLLGKGVHKPAPGKLMAIENNGKPNHCDTFESLPGFYQVLQWVCGGVFQNYESPNGLSPGEQEGRQKGQSKTCVVGPRTTNGI